LTKAAVNQSLVLRTYPPKADSVNRHLRQARKPLPLIDGRQTSKLEY
jgi:hypothetical protein